MAKGLHRPAWVKINLNNIRNNYQEVRDYLPRDCKMIAVVKAEAYGHGAVEVSRVLEAEGADILGVAISDEALSLREAGIQTPIMVFGITRVEDADLHAREDISVTVSELSWLKEAAVYINEGTPLKVNLKFDSGMSRLGVKTVCEAQEIIDYIAENENKFALESVYTHMAVADEEGECDDRFTHEQVEKFRVFREGIKTTALKHQPFYHQSNTAMMMWYPEYTLDAVRPGEILYGMTYPTERRPLKFPIKLAMEIQAEIVYLKQMRGGERVSYGAEYIASKGEWLATLPIGYADGWQRRYLGLPVQVGDIIGHSVGRICMDQMLVSFAEEVPAHSLVTLLGEHCGANEIGEYADTIAYEMTCLLGERLPRMYE